MFLSLLFSLLVAAPPAAPDTLVVCPAEFRAALAPWEALRRAQGHELAIVDPPQDAAELQATIRRTAAMGRLEYLLLIGDVPDDAVQAASSRVSLAPPVPAREALAEPMTPITVPTNFVPAVVNQRWGSEPTISSDVPFADVNGDGLPDLAVGRIPADSSEELAAAIGKIIRYEQRRDESGRERHLTAVAGLGGFGAMADALIDAAGQQIIGQAVPAGYVVSLTRANTIVAAGPGSRDARPAGPNDFPARIGRQMSDGCLVWAYLGHGRRTALDDVAGPRGPEPILSVNDVPRLRGADRCPLAIFVACYTGAFDAPRDSLAEELLLAEEGPVAVIAASRVSMPYGNTIFGYELLRASLADRPETIGAAMRLAQQRTLTPRTDDSMRKSFDTLAMTLSPLLQRGGPRWKPEDLATERAEHVAMYQLFGDPLMRWRRPGPIKLTAPPEVVAGATFEVEGQSDLDGNCVIELARIGTPATGGAGDDAVDKSVLVSASAPVRGGKFRIAVPLPADAAGRLTVRAYLRGEGGSAVGGASLVVLPAAERAAPAGAVEAVGR